MNTELNHESLRAAVAATDDKVIWTNDEAVGGLYTIDKLTFEVTCILDASQVFRYGKFIVQSVFQWEDLVIILPLELNRGWVIYNKKSRKTEYKDVVQMAGKTVGICIVKKKGILIPASTDTPVIIVDLETMKISRIIEDWSKSIKKDEGVVFQTWAGLVAGTDVYFPLQDTKTVIKIVQNHIDIFQAEIPCGICGISGSENGLWILPTGGDCIYEVDREGRLIKEVVLNVNSRLFGASDFARIVSADKYVFLLPVSMSKICVYDRQDMSLFMIGGEGELLENRVEIKEREITSYWGHCIEDNIVYFMPLKNKLLEFHLDTLEWKYREVYLPDLISGHNIMYWFGWNQWYAKGNTSVEWGKESLDLYINMIKKKLSICDEEIKCLGGKIWEEMRL